MSWVRRAPLWIAACSGALGCTRARPRVARESESASVHAVASSAPAARAAASADASAAVPVFHGGGPHAAHSRYGMVVSVNADATRAGVRILEHGGNAVDAAVAVAYTLAVTEPSAGNVGGGGFMLIRKPGGPTVAIDFREVAPAALTRKHFDEAIAAKAMSRWAVGVPGSVAGLDLARARFGRLPLARDLAPAIELARRGHHIGTREALTISWNWPKLSRNPAARRLFGAGGHPRKAGTLFKRPNLARTLSLIATRGAAGFYRGRVAKRLVAALGGAMSLEDLASYHAVVRQPLSFPYHGLTVQVMPPPSAGGVAVAQELLMLAKLHAERFPAESPEALHLFIEVSRRAQAERSLHVVDPDSLSPAERARRRRNWLDPNYLLSRAPHIDPLHATPSSELSPLYAAVVKELQHDHTTHFSVSDADGEVVSCTTTLSSGFGAKIVAPGTGIVLNDSVASFSTVGDNLPVPGRRTVSSMAPTLVLARDRPVLVLGTPGGNTIPSTIVQVLRNVVDYGMTLEAAVDAPRIHQDFVPDQVRDERRRPLPAKVREALEKMGHHFSKKRIPIGDANVILLQGDTAYGYADSRWSGLALGPSRPPARPRPRR